MATSLKKSITRNRMTGTEQPDEILLSPTEIGGSVKYSMGITKPFRTDTANWADPAIQPTIAQFKNSTVPGHSDHKNSPLDILDSGTDVTRSGWNIDNCSGMYPQGPIVSTIPESNRAKN